jgi:hypothetical protein
LLEVPLSIRNLPSVAVVIVCDLSKPQNCLSSLLRWIQLVREIIKRRLEEVKGSNAKLVASLKDSALNQYKETAAEGDVARARPCEIPLYIVANKYDTFKNNPNRRTLMQMIRFISHFHGATMITASSADAVLKESFRASMNSICFRTASKAVYDASVDKPVQITAGRDSFDSILMGIVRGGDSASSSKSKLANSEADFSLYLSSTGVTRDCWDRMSEILNGLVGPPDPVGSRDRSGSAEGGGGSGGGGMDGEEEAKEQIEFPEAEIDEMRSQRDAALQRYIMVRTSIR